VKKQPIADWHKWLVEYNAAYKRLDLEARKKFLENLVATYTDERQRKKVQEQIDTFFK
jgi:hypothetical protein